MDIVPTLTYIDRAIVVVRLNIVKLFRLRAYGMDYGSRQTLRILNLMGIQTDFQK